MAAKAAAAVARRVVMRVMAKAVVVRAAAKVGAGTAAETEDRLK